MKTVMLTTLARLPPARLSTWSICENTCFACASKLLAMSLPSFSRVAVWPATQTILPPSVITPGENARDSWNGVFSMYSAAAIGSETRASKSPARMNFMGFSLEDGVEGTLAQAVPKDKRGGASLLIPVGHVGEVDLVADVLRSGRGVGGLLDLAEDVGELDAEFRQLRRVRLDHRGVVGPEEGAPDQLDVDSRGEFVSGRSRGLRGGGHGRGTERGEMPMVRPTRPRPPRTMRGLNRERADARYRSADGRRSGGGEGTADSRRRRGVLQPHPPRRPGSGRARRQGLSP